MYSWARRCLAKCWPRSLAQTLRRLGPRAAPRSVSQWSRPARAPCRLLYALSKRHDISRQLIRVWVQKYEPGALDEDAHAADLLQEYAAKISALERMAAL